MLRFIIKNRYLLAAIAILALYFIHRNFKKITVVDKTGNNASTNTNTQNEEDEEDYTEEHDYPDIDIDLDYDYPTTTLKDNQVLFVTEKLSEVGQSTSGGKLYMAGTVVEVIDNSDANWWKVRTPDGLRGFMFSGYLNK